MEELSAVTERLLNHMFDGEGTKMYLSEHDRAIVTMYEGVYSLWREKPYLSDSEVVDYIISTHKVSRRQAYRYIAHVKIALSRIENAGRSWNRYRVVDMLLNAYNMAKEKGDTRGMISAAANIGRYTNLDKPDVESIDWSQVAPQNFEPVSDITLLGLPAQDPNDLEKLREKLQKKFRIKPAPLQGGTPIEVIEEIPNPSN